MTNDGSRSAAVSAHPRLLREEQALEGLLIAELVPLVQWPCSTTVFVIVTAVTTGIVTPALDLHDVEVARPIGLGFHLLDVPVERLL